MHTSETQPTSQERAANQPVYLFILSSTLYVRHEVVRQLSAERMHIRTLPESSNSTYNNRKVGYALHLDDSRKTLNCLPESANLNDGMCHPIAREQIRSIARIAGCVVE